MGGRKRVKDTSVPQVATPAVVLTDSQQIWKLLSGLWRWVEGQIETTITPRVVPGSLSIFSQDGGVKVCIRDRAQGRVAFVWAPCFGEALLKAQGVLVNDTADWRPDKYASNPGG